MNTLFASTLDRMRHEKALLVAQDDELAGKINEYQQQRAVIAGEIAGIDSCIAILESASAAPVEEAARKPRLDITQAVADYLARQDGPRSVAGIARAVGRKPSQVKVALSRLMLTGRALMLATDEGEKWRAPTTLAVAAE